ncbi:MAG TPA: HEAT repeat domain-containing protein [Actinomycetota bacterium]|nr:HEAT repeat domain-containing protein [Actinomycetota bacterium]
MGTDPQSRLSPALLAVVASDRRTRPRPSRLSADDRAALLDLVFAERHPGSTVRRDLAVRALAAGSEPRVAVDALAQILRARGIGTTERVIAADELGRLESEEAAAVLSRFTADDDPRVRQAVFAGLGRSGRTDALAALPESDPDAAARRQLLFARALVAHREGTDGAFLPEARAARGEPGAQGAAVALRPPSGKGASDPGRVTGGTYAIDVAELRYELQCGGNTWTTLFNGDLVRAGGIDHQRLFERPWIAALLARWILEGREAIVQHVVLARPVDASVRLDVVRSDGTVTYTGTAERDASGLRFVVRAADGAAVPSVHVEGRAGADGVAFTRAVASSSRSGTRTPEPALPA